MSAPRLALVTHVTGADMDPGQRGEIPVLAVTIGGAIVAITLNAN